MEITKIGFVFCNIQESEAVFKLVTDNTDLYFKIVFKSTSGASLWSLHAIKEMCAMDKRLVLDSSYASGNGCPSLSVGYYIGSMRNKDCEQLNDGDLSATMQV